MRKEKIERFEKSVKNPEKPEKIRKTSGKNWKNPEKIWKNPQKWKTRIWESILILEMRFKDFKMRKNSKIRKNPETG